MIRPAVFFDRDNTLIANDGYLGDAARVALIDGAAEAVARVRAMGFAAVTFSNQSGVARGMFQEEAVHAVNARMDEMMADQNPAAVIDRHEFCPYHPQASIERYRQDSELRKPRPGMILQAAEKLSLDLPRSWVIGDASRDIAAGRAAGCRTILFRDPKLSPSPAADETATTRADYIASTLKEAVDFIERNRMPSPADESPVIAGETPAPSPHMHEPPAAADSAAESAGHSSAPPATHASTASRVSEEHAPDDLPRKPTFADRVKSGTFAPARPAPGSPTTSGVATAEKPRRVLPLAERAGTSAGERGADAPSTVRPTEPVSQSDQLEPLLQQILEEMRRQQNEPYQEFSVSKLMAGVVQVLVLPVLFYAYLHHDQPPQVQTLLVLATFLQTLTIALLIMGRQR
ncbi:MAG TPA: HAD-IIIA family hydrolase [Tepidisphaeraceae bacterium]|nr:HAD-IIIA family hydrolase [Tepidisphaeraceae bacterium]